MPGQPFTFRLALPDGTSETECYVLKTEQVAVRAARAMLRRAAEVEVSRGRAAAAAAVGTWRRLEARGPATYQPAVVFGLEDMPQVQVMGSERAFYTLDRDLRFVAVGPRALSIWGKSKKDVVGRSMFEVFPWVENGPVHDALNEALQTFRPIRLQTPSQVLGVDAEVEIYPVNGGLQVSFEAVRKGSPRA